MRSHEYQREVVVGARRQEDHAPVRLWEVRIDSLLKLDRAVKRESNDDADEEAPR